MDIGLLSLLNIRIVDFHPGLVQGYANALRNAMELRVSADEKEKQKGFYLSAKRGLQDKLYVGNIHRIENHLYWNDEELADDDQIVNVVVIDGPVTRDGGACSYGSKDHRDQIMYANTIPQVVGHLFLINTPGGESSARIDYEQAFADCHEKGKPTVAWVDGLCASMGVNIASRCDRTIVMHGKDEYGCIGSMAAFWATPDGAIDSRDGSRWVEIVGDESPEKNAWWREAAQGEYDKLKAMVNESTNEFHQSVRENRPLVTDAMLNGDIFKAQDVMPALVDEIGDYNRAIECVFELADKKIPAARDITPDASPKSGESENPDEEPSGTVGDQEEMAKLNEQQKQAMAISHGDLMMAEDGHVTTSVQTMFGPEEKEIAKPKNNNDMREDENKATEVQEAPVAAEGEVANAPQPTEQPAGEATADEQPAEEAPAEETVQESQAELEKVTETLHNAEALVEQKDNTISEMQSTIDTLNGDVESLRNDIAAKDSTIAEMQASIEKLTADVAAKKKALAEKEEEIKELAEQPTPMTTSESGVPADNGTGDAPKVSKHLRFRRDMSYEEYRALQKED